MSDSTVPLESFIKYLITSSPDSHLVISPVSHNVPGLTVEEAMALCTERLVVIPGIEANLPSDRRDKRKHMILEGCLDRFYGLHRDEFSFGSVHFGAEAMLDYAESSDGPVLVLLPHPMTPVDWYDREDVDDFLTECHRRGILCAVETYNGADLALSLLRRRRLGHLPPLGFSDARKPELLQAAWTEITPHTDEIFETWKQFAQAEAQDDRTHRYQVLLSMLFRALTQEERRVRCRWSAAVANGLYDCIVLPFKHRMGMVRRTTR
jgi:hypothetical protein